MDQVVKMLETEQSVPTIPERPISFVAEMDEIEKSMSSNSGSGQFSSYTGYQAFTEIERPSSHKEEVRISDSSHKEEVRNSGSKPVELL